MCKDTIKMTLDVEFPQKLVDYLKMTPEDIKEFCEYLFNENMKILYEAAIATQSGVISKEEFTELMIQKGAQKGTEFREKREKEDDTTT